MSDLTIRLAQPDDALGIYKLLLRMFEEQDMPALDGEMAAIAIDEICKSHDGKVAWVVFDGDELVASAALVVEGFWWSSEPIMAGKWLYAVPEHRGATGAWGLMLHEIKDMASRVGWRVYVDVLNPSKSRKAGRLQETFERFSFKPGGGRLGYAPEA